MDSHTLIQALIYLGSAGLLTDCWEMRRLIATAFPPKEFYPER